MLIFRRQVDVPRQQLLVLYSYMYRQMRCGTQPLGQRRDKATGDMLREQDGYRKMKA